MRILDSVRARLTLWYVGTLALVLLAFSIGVYSITAYNLYKRLDAGLQTLLDVAVVSLRHGIDEGLSPESAARREVAELSNSIQSLTIYDAGGRMLAESAGRPGAVAALPPSLLQQGAAPLAYNAHGDSTRVMGRHVRVGPSGIAFFVLVSQPLDAVRNELELLRKIFLYAVPFTLLFAGLGGWLLAHRGLAPVVAMAEQAGRIEIDSLKKRLPVANPRDELGRLSIVFNELLARLEAGFDQQRQFMADASHELRTPISVIRTAINVTQERAQRSEEEYREALSVIGDQIRRLTRIVEDMFLLARADAGRLPLRPRPFYLDELLVETARAAAILAQPANVAIDLGAMAEMPFEGDEDLLRQMLLNLLDNAIKHTPAGGSVRLRATLSGKVCEIEVKDTGAGIPPGEQDRIFDRFYRVDKARGSDGGAGLGLSIARWIAEAHGGSLRLKGSDSNGSTFVIGLPISKV